MDPFVALVQGIYYFFVTGIWPILSIKTFLLVTDPKTDIWLVKTVGLVLASIGAALIFAQVNAQVNPAIVLFAISAALSLTFVEFYYVAKKVISPIYLANAFVELVLIGWWLISL